MRSCRLDRLRKQKFTTKQGGKGRQALTAPAWRSTGKVLRLEFSTSILEMISFSAPCNAPWTAAQRHARQGAGLHTRHSPSPKQCRIDTALRRGGHSPAPLRPCSVSPRQSWSSSQCRQVVSCPCAVSVGQWSLHTPGTQLQPWDAYPLLSTAFCAYSVWKTRPSGLKVLTERSYCGHQTHSGVMSGPWQRSWGDLAGHPGTHPRPYSRHDAGLYPRPHSTITAPIWQAKLSRLIKAWGRQPELVELMYESAVQVTESEFLAPIYKVSCPVPPTSEEVRAL